MQMCVRAGDANIAHIPVNVTYGISGSPIESQWGSR